MNKMFNKRLNQRQNAKWYKACAHTIQKCLFMPLSLSYATFHAAAAIHQNDESRLFVLVFLFLSSCPHASKTHTTITNRIEAKWAKQFKRAGIGRRVSINQLKNFPSSPPHTPTVCRQQTSHHHLQCGVGQELCAADRLRRIQW